jgi:hypothetical protein
LGQSLNRELVSQLAISDTLARAGKERDVIAVYIKGTSLTWQNWDTFLIRAFGAAIERAGRIVDALSYYEDVRGRRIVDRGDHRETIRKDVAFADQRWCKCKYRQAEFSRSRGKMDDYAHQRGEADLKLLQLGIKLDDLPEYPRLESLDNGVHRPALSETVTRMISTLASSEDGFDVQQIASALGLPVDVVSTVIAANAATSNQRNEVDAIGMADRPPS